MVEALETTVFLFLGGNMKNKVFLEGLRDGLPIGLGYFAVSFSLGIVARNASLTPVQDVADRGLGAANTLGDVPVSEIVHLFETKDFRDLHVF